MSESQLVTTQLDNNVLSIVMNRPERRNALTLNMYTVMAEALEAVNSQPEARAVVIKGVGDAFSAGNDLKDFLSRESGAVSPAIRFLQALRDCEKPVIASVNGLAIGIGVTMLLHCDLVYMVEGAQLRLPFSALGLVPEAGSSLILPRMVGRHKAAEMLLLGEFFSAESALEAGIGNAVIAAAELDDVVMAKATTLANLPMNAIRHTKRLLNATASQDLDGRMAEEFELFGELLQQPDAREAMQAFLEKRSPKFNQA